MTYTNDQKLPVKQSSLSWWWLTLIILLADQASKHWVASHFSYGESVEILPFFNFTYVHNLGAAFSFLSDAGGWQRWFFAAIAFGMSILLIYWMRTTPKENVKLGLAYALILSGAVGNLIDRVALGYVIDFIHFYYKDWHYPAFNIADSAIFIGAALLIWDAFSSKPVNGEKQLS